jgi:hypothetical protein
MVILLMMVCPIQVNDVVSCGLGLVDGDTVDDGLPYTSLRIINDVISYI